MIYVKSVLAGLAATFAVAVVGILGFAGYQLAHLPSDGIGAMVFVIHPHIVPIALLIFLPVTVGFYRRFRRAS